MNTFFYKADTIFAECYSNRTNPQCRHSNTVTPHGEYRECTGTISVRIDRPRLLVRLPPCSYQLVATSYWVLMQMHRFSLLLFPSFDKSTSFFFFGLGKKGVRKGWRRLNKKRHLLRRRFVLSTRHARSIADGVFFWFFFGLEKLLCRYWQEPQELNCSAFLEERGRLGVLPSWTTFGTPYTVLTTVKTVKDGVLVISYQR